MTPTRISRADRSGSCCRAGRRRPGRRRARFKSAARHTQSTAWRAALLLAIGLALVPGCSKRVLRHPEPTLPAQPQWPRTIRHRIAAGETLGMIADNYYGDPGLGGQIARQNGVQDPARLTAGSTLVLQFGPQEWQIGQKRAAAMKPYNRGVDLLAQNDLEAAEREFHLALRIAPGFVNARYNLALVLLKRGKHEEAEKRLAALVQDRPQEPDFLFAYGHTLFLEARFAPAAAVFQRLLSVDPSHRRGAFGLARALQAAGRSAEAITAWEAYLALDNSSAWAEAARRHLRELRRE